ncbi:hypothetical protein [Spirosoma telluris]
MILFRWRWPWGGVLLFHPVDDGSANTYGTDSANYYRAGHCFCGARGDIAGDGAAGFIFVVGYGTSLLLGSGAYSLDAVLVKREGVLLKSDK